jgi:hypothetical protein
MTIYFNKMSTNSQHHHELCLKEWYKWKCAKASEEQYSHKHSLSSQYSQVWWIQTYHTSEDGKIQITANS